MRLHELAAELAYSHERAAGLGFGLNAAERPFVGPRFGDGSDLTVNQTLLSDLFR